jgi:hypothetical protein
MLDYDFEMLSNMKAVSYFSANHRMCMKTCEVGERKLRMEEGTVVQANVWSIHYNKKTWGDDADFFHPERSFPVQE